MASFQAEIDWKRQRKRKNKIYRSVSFLPRPELKVPENQQKKIKNLKNTITAKFLAKIGWERFRK